MRKNLTIIGLILLLSCYSHAQIVMDNDTIINNDTDYINWGSINFLPFYAGEVRLVDFLDLLPGIHNYRNNFNKFSVLGSPNEHNFLSIENSALLLAPNIILNTSMLNDLIFNQTFKPLKYNNAISSITEIGIRNNVDSLKISGQLTPISTQITGEVPVTKSSNLVFATNYRFGQLFGNQSEKYSELYNLPYIQDSSLINDNYDFLVKYNHQIGVSDKLSFTYYRVNEKSGFDLLNISQDRHLFSLKWQNNSNSNQLITNGISYSSFNSKALNNTSQYSFISNSNYKNIRYYLDVEHLIIDKLQIKYGVNVDYFNVLPYNLTYSINNIDTTIVFGKRNSLITSVYAINNYQFTDWFYVNMGLKYSAYTQLGPGTQYSFENANIDTAEFRSGEIMQFYHGLIPTISFNLKPARNTDISLVYESNLQYINSIQSGNTQNMFALNNPYLISATNNIKPTRMNSIYLVFSQNIKRIKVNIMPFYRKMNELVELREGAFFLMLDSYENELFFGSGNSYGITSSLHKSYGKISGWINYSYVNSTKKFDVINNGESFNSTFVKNHDVSMVLIYGVSAKWNISSVFKYYSGERVSLPVSHFNYNGSFIPYYSDQNYYKAPDYFRFDLAINRTYVANKINHYFSLGLMNLCDNNTFDNLKGESSDFLLGIRPYLKYRFEFLKKN